MPCFDSVASCPVSSIIRSALGGIKNRLFGRSDTIQEEISPEDDLNDADLSLYIAAPQPKHEQHKADLTKPPMHWDDNWDGRNHMSADKYAQKPTARRHYLLIRHGQYNNYKVAKATERKLTALGRQQALKTRDKIRRFRFPIERIYSSTMTRAKETSCLILEALPGQNARQTDLLREGTFVGPLSNRGDLAVAECQRFNDRLRIEEAFRLLFHRASPDQKKDSVEMYVCHRNVIHYFVCRALQYPEKEWPWINIPHCSMTYLTVQPDGTVSLDCLADIGHLPPDNVTSV